MPPIPGYPLARFLMSASGEPGEISRAALSSLHDADVILGRDIRTGDEFVAYGRDVLRRVADGLDHADGYNILCIEIVREPTSPDLELLLQLVQTIKGRHDYLDHGS